MKIAVVVRTLNESHRIGPFCSAYERIADTILVADGGSSDGTICIAQTYPKVVVRDFPQRTAMQAGKWRNNDSDHANFLFEWARSLSPDWIIYDDCDMRPNYLLKANARRILAETDCEFVLAVKLYLWGLRAHFPQMARPGKDGRWEGSLWAWRGHLDFWTIDVPPAYEFRIGEQPVTDLRVDARTLELLPPYCLMHYSWDDAERTQQKVDEYRESGLIPGQLHPLEFAGTPEPLPEWARE